LEQLPLLVSESAQIASERTVSQKIVLGAGLEPISIASRLCADSTQVCAVWLVRWKTA
jgi:cytidine deaminase